MALLVITICGGGVVRIVYNCKFNQKNNRAKKVGRKWIY